MQNFKPLKLGQIIPLYCFVQQWNINSVCSWVISSAATGKEAICFLLFLLNFISSLLDKIPKHEFHSFAPALGSLPALWCSSWWAAHICAAAALQAALCRHSLCRGDTQVYLERSVHLLLKGITLRMGMMSSHLDLTHGETRFLFWQSCWGHAFVLCLLIWKSSMATLLPGVKLWCPWGVNTSRK